jgi:putative endonuclease
MFLFVTRRKLLSDIRLLGRWGEMQAHAFLRRKGLRILARNFSCKTGELDLVMADPQDGSIVFVEVKTRRSEDYLAAETAVTPEKRKRITSAARCFRSLYHVDDRPARFDVMAIVLGPKGKPQIRHYEHAFVP